ncbi:unnamed protein product [Rotaria sp. Silwood2]|nr:unnamed protein product [Rotaria sp. Silwood2]CAF2929203.1 unnamed protein product [Rotaria sp. Silwood2]CAF2973089.1 unnamed protein product [Rotaria sp. Silwood2]CAF3856471.1 unnamed protein product [Rotaria sp. Silwood2]CAF3993374.1 unnamed protein product [Rotaria sp. Silwood2]
MNDMYSRSSLGSVNILKSERIYFKAIRSISLQLCTCALIINWLRLGFIYLFPKVYPNLIQSSLNLCITESFFLHVLTFFHLHLIICLRLYWHYCFIFEKYWQTITYRRILFILLFTFICLCLFTLPSISNDWASIIYDEILQICIVNYLFHYSYTFFVLTFTCLIPFVLIIISHKLQMKAIENRIFKYISMDEKLNLSQLKVQFQYSSYIILIWSFINILLSIFLHTPIKYLQIRIILYYSQIYSFLLDPIIYILILRSLPTITLLRPTNKVYFI